MGMSYEELNGKENNCECWGLGGSNAGTEGFCEHFSSLSLGTEHPHPSLPGSLEPAQQINSISSQWLFQHVFFYLFDLP